MTLLRRPPRVVYRVYAEDAFLSGAGDELFDVAEGALPSVDDRSEIDQLAEGQSEGTVDVAGPVESFRPAASEVGERRLRRLAGAAMLAGAVGAVGGVVVASGLRPARSTGGRRGGSPPATRSYAATRSQRPAVGVTHTLHGARRRGGLRDGAWRSHAKGTQRHAGVERGGSPAIVARSTTGARAGAPGTGHAEFGFER
jgi:hypothetical protein